MRTFVRSIIVAGACLAGASVMMAQSGPASGKEGKKTLSYLDHYFEKKQGHYTPEEEARLRAARENSASRSEAQPSAKPETFIEQRLRVKQGITVAK